MKTPIVYITLILLLASCEKRSDWDLHNTGNEFIVVNAIITNEFKVQTVTITKPVSQLNQKPDPVKGATVMVSTNGSAFTFHESSSSPGTYYSDKAFIGVRNKTYSLLITSGNKVYTSKAVLEPPVLFNKTDSVRYQKNTADNFYHLVRLPSTYRAEKAAMYEIELDWSSVAGYQGVDPDLCKAKLMFYTLPTIDVSEVLAPSIEQTTFPKGTMITERRYSLTDEHAEFVRALLLETTWQGGYFNTASANVPTNISEGAMGFFGACGVTEKTEQVK